MADVRQETWWVLRAQTGDREALNALLQAVQEPLYRYALSLVGQPPLAEDILQNAFLRIYQNLKALREPELFRPWAYRITHREALKVLKRERIWTEQIRDETLLESLPAQPVTTELTTWETELLPELIAQLSPASRAVIVLHYLHDQTLDEIAAALELPIGTVKSRLAYGLSSLRRQFANFSSAPKGEPNAV
jgi:RNA polymerase sigma-70 factor, ECF subfamily